VLNVKIEREYYLIQQLSPRYTKAKRGTSSNLESLIICLRWGKWVEDRELFSVVGQEEGEDVTLPSSHIPIDENRDEMKRKQRKWYRSIGIAE